jgi:Protein of unknown function (DUF3891)
VLLVDHPDGKVAVAQPAHAWISGQLAQAWGNERFGPVEPGWEVCLAAEQHDIPWLEWERRPKRDRKTGYPHTFMSLPMRDKHAMWSDGPELLLAQSRYAALLVSLHGSRLYRDLDRSGFESRIRDTLDAPDEEIERNHRLVWAWDGMSLALLLGWRPWTAEAVPAVGGPVDIAFGEDGTVTPWPFGAAAVTVECEGRLLTAPSGRQAELDAALAAAPWVKLTYELVQ